MDKFQQVTSKFYPEVLAGGFTSVDGSIDFYSRINALLDESKEVLDFGAGRAAWFEDDPSPYRKALRLLKGKVKRVVGCDISGAVHENRAVDETVQTQPGEPLPFKDGEFDLMVSDYTFEHIADPVSVAGEFHRILKPGGWICARTPNKYCYVSIITRLVKNSLHSRILKYAQPERKDEDVFPTTFKLNTRRSVAKYFTSDKFENYSYMYEAEPVYHFNNRFVYWMFYMANRLTPRVMKTNLYIFLRKR